MKKFIYILLSILFLNFAFADENPTQPLKYTVLKVQKDNSPLRNKNNENANRITHLYKNTILYATEQLGDYYKIEQDENLYGYINQKDVVELEKTDIKLPFTISNIETFINKKSYNLKLYLDNYPSYKIVESKTGLDLILYNTSIEPELELNSLFKIEPQENKVKISYNSNEILFGYDLKKADFGYILSVKKVPKINFKKPLKNIIIVVDPGHGGIEKGACAFNLKEKDINLQISKKLKKELSKLGAKVYLTRSKDKTVPLYDRVDFAKKKNADILLSINQNSLPDRANVAIKHGAGTYYYYNQARTLAYEINRELVINTRFRDDGVNHASFALTRNTEPISVLVECGYIIHPLESEKISDRRFQKIIAKAISKGVSNYLTRNFL